MKVAKGQNTLLHIGFVLLCFALGTIFLGSAAEAVQKKMPFAAVKMGDGNIYELTEAEFKTSADRAGGFYTLHSSFTLDKLRLKLPPKTSYLVMDIPVAEIKEIVAEKDHDTISVTLQDGQNLKGSWSSVWMGDQYMAALQASTQVEGYPGKVEIPKGKIDRIAFAKGADGTVAAQVTTTDGEVKQNLTDPKFKIDGGDSRGSHFSTDKLNFKTGDTTIEIPVEEIVSIDRRGKQHLLTLNNGKSLTGEAYFVLTGKTKAYGRPAHFHAGVGIVYVTFKDMADLERSLQEDKTRQEQPPSETGKTSRTAKPPASSESVTLASKTIPLSPPQDLLPPFQTELKGANEVRVNNPNDSSVQVGLRQGGRGKNFTVPAHGVVAVKVPNGKYDVYFVYADKLDALFQGDSFSLNNNGVEIRLVKVVAGNYGIKRVK